MNIAARKAYTKRQPPAQWDAGWFANEMGLVQQAIPIVTAQQVAVDTTMQPTDDLILVDATAGAVRYTLLPPSRCAGAVVTIKKIDASANAVTIVGTIDGVVNYTVGPQYAWMTVQCDGVSFWRVS